MNSYLSIEGFYERETVIERSKFIAAIKNVENVDEAKAFLEERKKRHGLATHNCYGYITDIQEEKQKFSDDGEPQGVAGLPIIDSVKKAGLKNVAVVVSRYFGGIKLGASGLTRAYASITAEAINFAKKVEYTLCSELELRLSYEKYQKIPRFLGNRLVKIKETIFDAFVTAVLILPKEQEEEFAQSLKNYFLGEVNYKKTDEYFKLLKE